ncbi:Hypothetical predicted protein [Olea europaea subsp. europaea]|uniref:BZIP domain-containing protein n=1 Tax=Olea europaea subsp. europaea TaxID=158383 RepID=A0A8S0VEI2_OLEEU|nr:Hypothetical predicted protein [Olea europaea subsp. europaea]
MERQKLCEEAKVDEKTVTYELEAAEVLAAMARCSSVSDLREERLQTESVCTHFCRRHRGLKFSGNLSTSVANPVDPEQNVETTTRQLCSTSYPSNATIKSRRTLSEAYKEEQRRRRVLANRESARRTIRRRQVRYVGFTSSNCAYLLHFSF